MKWLIKSTIIVISIFKCPPAEFGVWSPFLNSFFLGSPSTDCLRICNSLVVHLQFEVTEHAGDAFLNAVIFF